MPSLVWILGLIVVTWLAVFAFLYGQRSQITTVHYINMDKDTTRREFMETQLAHYGAQVQRWPGWNVKGLTVDELTALHIGEPVYSVREQLWDGKLRNVGVMGCWLSHTSLLKHLAAMPNAKQQDAHLILEDDVYVPPDILARWAALPLPKDWDVVYLGIGHPTIDKTASPSPALVKLKYGRGNAGMYAYVVRHGALQTKILPRLQQFTNAIDMQLSAMFDVLDVYAVMPAWVDARSPLQDKSSIDSAP